jgi:hypothetical protein
MHAHLGGVGPLHPVGGTHKVKEVLGAYPAFFLLPHIPSGSVYRRATKAWQLQKEERFLSSVSRQKFAFRFTDTWSCFHGFSAVRNMKWCWWSYWNYCMDIVPLRYKDLTYSSAPDSRLEDGQAQ